MTPASIPPCSVCKRRKAIYYHKASGNVLCELCLRKTLVKSIHKAFSRYGLVKDVRPAFGYVIDLSYLPLSISMYELFLYSERKFINNINIIYFYNEKCSIIKQCIRKIINTISNNVNIRIVREIFIKSNKSITCVEKPREIRAKMLKHKEAEGLAMKYLVIPLAREHVITRVLTSIAGMNLPTIADYAPILEVGDLKVINPFYDVLVEDIVAYAISRPYFSEIFECSARYSCDNCINNSNRLKREIEELLADTVWVRGRELVFSFENIRLFLSRAIEGNNLYARCSLCKGLDYKSFIENNEGLCRVCSKIFKHKSFQ